MATVIDWHAHHTPPELVDRFVALGEKPPRIDPEDDADFERRIDEMDAAGIDRQLVSPGAGVTGDRFPAETAIELTRLANDVIADRIAPYPDRLMGNIAITMNTYIHVIPELRRDAADRMDAILQGPER